MGYLVCKVCQGYYQLQNDEYPDDFETCECGGELLYYNTIDEFIDTGIDLNKLILCPFCGSETPEKGNFCGECGEDINSINIAESTDFQENNFEKTSDNKNIRRTISEYQRKKDMELQQARKKGAFKVQKKLESQGYYIIKGSGKFKSITLQTDGIIIGNTTKTSYEDIISVEATKNKDKTKETIGVLVFLPYLLLVANYQTIKIIFHNKTIELNNVKKNDAINCIGYIEERISN